MASVRAVAAEHTEPARMPPLNKTRSIAPLAILILLLIAAGGAAVWFFIIRPKAAQNVVDNGASGSAGSAGAGSAGSGSAAVVASGSDGSADGSDGSGAAGSAAIPASANGSAAKADLTDTVIGSSAEGATIEVVGTDQSGPAPLIAKLEKGKTYKARISARGFAASEVEVKGGEKQVAKLVAKPRIITVTTEPTGALLSVDNATTGHSTPFDIELTAAQAAKKTVRVQIRKSGFKTLERVVDLAKMTEDDTKMTSKLEEKLVVQPAPVPRPVTPRTPPPGVGSGSDAAPTVTPPEGGEHGGSEATPPATPPVTPPAAEPEPKFNEPTTHPQ